MSDAPPAGGIRRLLPLLLLAAAAAGYASYRTHLASRPYEWSGTVEARTISVGSRTGGRVKEVHVREGERVAPGQPLLTLEPGDGLAQLAQAQGQLDQMRATLQRLEAGARPEELEQAHARAQGAAASLALTKAGARQEEIAAAEARLAAQTASAEKARLDSERVHGMVHDKIVSPSEVDAADALLRAALATRDALGQELARLKNGARPEEVEQARAHAAELEAADRLARAGARAEDIAFARAQVASAEGRVAQVQTLLDELVVRAPRAARVEACDLRPGDLLAPSATAATLLEDDQLYLRIYVPETSIGHIAVGQRVPFTVDSFPGETFEGLVEHVNEVGEYSPRNLQTADERADQVFGTRIAIASGADRLRAGMAAFVHVPR